jgi:glutaredoxin-related protein
MVLLQAAVLEVAVTGQSSARPSAEPQDLNAHLAALVGSAPVMLFIKGSASAPKCKFSREIVEILTEEAIQFGTFDILSDEAVSDEMLLLVNFSCFGRVEA